MHSSNGHAGIAAPNMEVWELEKLNADIGKLSSSCKWAKILNQISTKGNLELSSFIAIITYWIYSHLDLLTCFIPCDFTSIVIAMALLNKVTDEELATLAGKTIVITGGGSGIGKTAATLAYGQYLQVS